MTDDLDRETLRSLLRMLAHDLRNPLSALQSNISFIGSVTGESDPDVAEALEDSMVSCESLAHIIDNLEALAASYASPDSGIPTAMLLEPLVEEAVQRNHRMAASHGVALSLSKGLGKGGTVLSQREMLTRAIDNLIKNAIQYCPEGHAVTVSTALDASDGLVRVEDSGPTLAPEFVSRAFTAAGQVDAKSMSGGRYSRGLGLFAAAIQATAAGARIQSVPTAEGNALELRLALTR